MTGARIEITVDDAAVLDVLQQAQARLAPDGMRALLDELGETLKTSTELRSYTESGPDGEPWPALSPRYAKRKAKRHPGKSMLHADEHMLGDQLAWQVDGDVLRVGTNAPYGARQQFGGGGIPARPWLGVSAADAEEIKTRTLAFIREAVGDS